MESRFLNGFYYSLVEQEKNTDTKECEHLG